MRTGDVDILIVPGFGGNDANHWQSRWVRNLRTAREVTQDDWLNPDRDAWAVRIVEAVATARRPAVLVGHSLGVPAIAHAAAHLDPGRVAGAFLVAPPDLDAQEHWPVLDIGVWPPGLASFAPMPMTRLPFPSRLIGSSDDSFCTVARAQDIGRAWGSDVSIVANAGHVNSASGHGPWPEGLLTFGVFLNGLGPARPTLQ